MGEAKGSTHLTRNQGLVLKALEKSKSPAGAYELLGQLREDGLRAPPQIYRALDSLVEMGLAHRLDSLNAYVACSHPDCVPHETVAFAICNSCGEVDEITDEKLSRQIRTLARENGLGLTKSTVELRGLCTGCEDELVKRD